jgi:ribosomal subunit interface protein
MQVPLELTFRHMDKSEALADLIREQADKLSRYCDHINHVAVAVELDHASSGAAHEYRVRVDVTVAGGHEVVGEERSHKNMLPTTARTAFQQVARQLKRLTDTQKNEVKRHPAQELAGVVNKLFGDYGFIATSDGREVYFHERSVVSPSFAELKVGMGVAFSEEVGEQGPQASSLRVVDGRGHRRDTDDVPAVL